MSESKELVEKSCDRCEYERGSECYFPEPRKGGEAPFMASASMPDSRENGLNCHHFRRARTLTGDTK